MLLLLLLWLVLLATVAIERRREGGTHAEGDDGVGDQKTGQCGQNYLLDAAILAGATGVGHWRRSRILRHYKL